MIFKIIFHSNCQNHQSFVPLICQFRQIAFLKKCESIQYYKNHFREIDFTEKIISVFLLWHINQANKLLLCNMFVCWHLLNVYWKASNFFFKTCHKYFSGFRKLILIFLNCWFFVKSHGCQLTLIRRVAQTVGCVVLWKVTKNYELSNT